MTEKDFEEAMWKVDSLAVVQFNPEDGPPMSVRIVPSSPDYRAALILQANYHRPMGVVVSVMKLVDDWYCCFDEVERVSGDSSALPPSRLQRVRLVCQHFVSDLWSAISS